MAFEPPPTQATAISGKPPACHNHDIAAGRFLHRPMAAEGTTNPQDLAALELPHGFGYRADHASGVLQQRNIAGVAADGDRHFSHAEDIQHVELARRKRELLAGIFGKNLQGEGVVRLLLYALNAVRRSEEHTSELQ